MKNFARRVVSACVLCSLFIQCLIVFGPVTMAQVIARKQKCNDLFIIADDLRTELGAYGVEGIKTPNIDVLAARSTRFDCAFANYPLCNPSRSSFLTGRYPTQTKVLNSNDYFRRIDPTTVTLPQYF